CRKIMSRSPGSSTLIGGCVSSVSIDQTFYDHHVVPYAVEAAVAFVDAYFTESNRSEQSAARGILDKDSRDELRESRDTAGGDQSRTRKLTDSPPSDVPVAVHRELRDARVAFAGPVLTRRSKRDDPFPLVGDHDNGVPSIEPKPHVRCGARRRLERRNPIRDAL